LYDSWRKNLEEITFAFNGLFDYVDRDTINFKPDKNSWSVGEILEHMLLVNESYYPIFDEVAADSFDPPWFSRFEFLVDMFGRMILKSVEPERNRKVKTLKRWKPQKSTVDFNVLDRFFKGQIILGKHLKLLIPYAEEEIVIHSPASKIIVYQIDVAIEIIIAHEKRHLNQALEVVAILKSLKK